MMTSKVYFYKYFILFYYCYIYTTYKKTKIFKLFYMYKIYNLKKDNINIFFYILLIYHEIYN